MHASIKVLLDTTYFYRRAQILAFTGIIATIMLRRIRRLFRVVASSRRMSMRVRRQCEGCVADTQSCQDKLYHVRVAAWQQCACHHLLIMHGWNTMYMGDYASRRLIFRKRTDR